MHSPSPIVETGDIVTDVVLQNHTSLRPQRVSAAHVAENTHADVPDSVESHIVANCLCRRIAPRPTNTYTRILKVAYVVVLDGCVRHLLGEDTTACFKHVSTIMYDTVLNGDIYCGRYRR